MRRGVCGRREREAERAKRVSTRIDRGRGAIAARCCALQCSSLWEGGGRRELEDHGGEGGRRGRTGRMCSWFYFSGENEEEKGGEGGRNGWKRRRREEGGG
eukprot:1027885-Rhodomonas_salina.1